MEAKKCKRLPYGNSDFESVRTGGYAYVDKTRFIELLENEPNRNLFFIRPRKFGKSLFFSMLSHYYDIAEADKFEQLFGDLYIGKHPTPMKNSYLVLKFNFSGLNTSTENDFQISFIGKIQQSLLAFLDEHANYIPDAAKYKKECEEQMSLTGKLLVAFRAALSAKRKIYVIIDEYDHFANDLMALGTTVGDDVYRKMVRANGIVRDFYETLKEGTETVINGIMITGITPIMLDDMTSGFNIASSLSLDPLYNEMLGFTADEVKALMIETGVDPALINVDMELFYNGYLFHKDGEHRVYNPSMMLYFFNQILRSGKVPENIVDENLKTDYGRLRSLIMNEQNSTQLMEIIQNNGIVSEIIPKFSIDQLHDNEYFVSLLFYMGLLTIDRQEEGLLRLKIPNYSIRTIYWDYILRLIKDRNEDVLIDFTQLRLAVRELAYRGNPVPFVDYVSRNILIRLSNRDLERFDEKQIKIILLGTLFQSKMFVPITELEVTQGYTDVWLQRSHLFPEIPHEWVWEIKYVKKAGLRRDTALQTARDKAREQLEKYRRSHQFAGRTDVRYLSGIFIGKDKYEMTELAV
ncbi:AAA family ATPase [Candidatus Symbiothrix dinenymphae]|uniref:AAA family ATPase n=1 Tax=Candidatus Symbiothrix dinenymphae TaxID=467085 RepID=UPI000703AF61|nr:AAA family ATPase [Candidatus Symbiothrix dinenymphae]